MRAFLVSLASAFLVVSTGNAAHLNQHSSITPGGMPEIVQHAPERGGDTVRMWKRAQFRVVPLDTVAADNAELGSLRACVMQSEFEAAKLATTAPGVREQFSRQIALTRALLNFIDRQQSEVGKNRTVLEVENNLNHLQGQMMCEACHSRVIASVKPAISH